jgi:signal transduction histidine kinase
MFGRRVEALHKAFPYLSVQMLEHVANNAREVHIEPGDRVCEEGEPGDIFYVIISGRVQVSKLIGPDTHELLNELYAGDFFGELALIGDAPRLASVHALEQTDLLAITKDDFQTIINHSPLTAVAILRAVSARLRDSDQRLIEDLRRKNQDLNTAYARLEQTVKQKSDFLTVIAHELRTPLTAIKGYAHLMRTGMLNGEDLQRGLSVIANNSEAIVQLTNNILFMQELELIPPSVEPVDLRQLIYSAVDEFQAPAARNGLSFTLKLPATLPRARGDLDDLAQAFRALIDNAIKFSPNGGEIKISGQSYKGLTEVAITDPGVGIPQEHLYHIFDRYQHLEKIGDHLFGGVGLGLPIARQVIQQHGGTISVVSRIGEGSTFTVRLPVYQEKPRTLKRAPVSV